MVAPRADETLAYGSNRSFSIIGYVESVCVLCLDEGRRRGAMVVRKKNTRAGASARPLSWAVWPIHFLRRSTTFG